MPRTERLGILLGLVVVGLGIAIYVPLPSPMLAFRLPGVFSVISFTLTPARQVSLVVALLACAIVDGSMRRDERLADASLARTMPFWVLPALLILGAFAVFERLIGPIQQMLGLAAITGLLGLVIIAQWHIVDPENGWFAIARTVLNAVAYGLALATYFLTHTSTFRNLIAIPLIAVISALLTLELVESACADNRRIWGGAALAGLMMAEVAWALGSGATDPLVVSFFLLVVFYGITGVLQQYLWGRLQRHIAVEFLAVGVLALVLLLRLIR